MVFQTDKVQVINIKLQCCLKICMYKMLVHTLVWSGYNVSMKKAEIHMYLSFKGII